MTPRDGADRMIEVEVNCPDAACAQGIAEAAVAAGLAACANILPGVKSVYRWQGAIETAPETALRFKTREACFAPLCDLIVRLHPYELPAIVALLSATGPGYEDWLRAGTEPGTARNDPA